MGDAIGYVGEENLRKGMVDGRLYGIPTRPGKVPLYFTYWIRQDWLDALGLTMPETIDDLFEVARTFTEQDPDGNGQADTYGITGAGLTGSDNAFTPIYGAFGVGNPGTIYVKDGQLVSAYFDPGMPGTLAFINAMIEAGVVDPELVDQPEKRQKVFELMNYIGSEEGANLVQYGIEGRHFTIENGEIVPTELLNEEGTCFFVYQLLGRDEEKYLYTRLKFAMRTASNRTPAHSRGADPHGLQWRHARAGTLRGNPRERGAREPLH